MEKVSDKKNEFIYIILMRFCIRLFSQKIKEFNFRSNICLSNFDKNDTKMNILIAC